MATDADSTAGDDDPRAESDATGAFGGDTDSLAEPVGRSVAGTRESIYLARITVLQLRVNQLESEVTEREQTIQSIRDRYEQVLDGPTTYPGDPLAGFEPRGAERTDGGQRVTDEQRVTGDERDSATAGALLDRLRVAGDRLRDVGDRLRAVGGRLRGLVRR